MGFHEPVASFAPVTKGSLRQPAIAWSPGWIAASWYESDDTDSKVWRVAYTSAMPASDGTFQRTQLEDFGASIVGYPSDRLLGDYASVAPELGSNNPFCFSWNNLRATDSAPVFGFAKVTTP